ncbi:hypothetical protein J6590_094406 [Homalodisca vitripennis]|nr:hypothetical protein J6590_094406 [Homalodisca vitripennis]
MPLSISHQLNLLGRHNPLTLYTAPAERLLNCSQANRVTFAVKEDAPGVALPAKNCKTESENDPPPMIPKIIRVLHDMRQDLVLLRNLRAFLASLRQFNRFVNLSGQPFLGQENSQDAIRGA